MAISIVQHPAAQPRPEPSESERKAGIIFNEISELAHAVERFGVLLVAMDAIVEVDERDRDALLKGVKAMTSQIGVLADLGAVEVGAFACFGGVDEWLLPPIYQTEVATGALQ